MTPRRPSAALLTRHRAALYPSELGPAPQSKERRSETPDLRLCTAVLYSTAPILRVKARDHMACVRAGLHLRWDASEGWSWTRWLPWSLRFGGQRRRPRVTEWRMPCPSQDPMRPTCHQRPSPPSPTSRGSRDSHMTEPLDLWEKHLPPSLRDRAPHFPQRTRDTATGQVRAGGGIRMSGSRTKRTTASAPRCSTPPSARPGG